MYVFFFFFFNKFFLSNEKNAISFKDREKERKKKKKREWQSGGPVEKKVRKKKSLVLSIGPTIFNLFTKKPLNNVTWKLKIGMVNFQNMCFKYPKLRTITQTLLIKNSYQT